MPTYRLYGLVVASAIPLPGLAPITDRGDPDVVVRETTLSPASESDDDLRLSVTAGEIAVDEDEIRVDGTVGASATPGEPSLETYLLGWGIATLCHLRGRLVLHASAVRFDGCTVAFLGDSGRGKSTTAAALADCGADVVCDDVLPLAVGKASETAGENRSPLPTVEIGRAHV